ncbi:hypothetical protein NliqN6_5035, partial [Naganishia liquefaciens]
RSNAGSPAPILLPGGQYSASSGRSASPYSNLAARSGARGVNSPGGAQDTHNVPYSTSHSSGSFGASTRDPVPRFTESPYQADSYSKTAQQLEHQNDDKLEGLMSKVRILKDASGFQLVTIGIGDEVRQSNMELGNMNDAFSSTSTFLNGTFQRMNRMARRQGGQWCYLMLFLILVLWIFVILWIKRR